MKTNAYTCLENKVYPVSFIFVVKKCQLRIIASDT